MDSNEYQVIFISTEKQIKNPEYVKGVCNVSGQQCTSKLEIIWGLSGCSEKTLHPERAKRIGMWE